MSNRQEGLQPHPSAAPSASLQRTIGLKGLVFALIGSTIGSGWLFAGLYAAQIAGPAALLAWGIGGLVVFLFSLAYMELGIAFPISGGMVKYSQFSHGSLVGFLAGLSGWLCYVMVAPLEVLAILQYASNYLPWLARDQGSAADLTPAGYAVAITLLLLLTVVNLTAIRWVIRIHNRIVDWKLIIPIATLVLLFSVDFHPENFTAHGGFFAMGPASMLTAIMAGGILYSTYGFRVVVDLAGEARNPGRDIPRAIALGLGAVVLFYALLQTAFLGALRPEDLADGWAQLSFPGMTGPYAALLTAGGLAWMAAILYADAIISPAGTGLIFATSTSRLAMAMSETRYFPAVFAPLNRKGIPARAIGLNFAVGLVLFAPLPDWQAVVSFGAAATVLSFGFAQITLASMRRVGLPLTSRFRVRGVGGLAWGNFVVINALLFAVGWESNRMLLLVLLACFALFGIHRWRSRWPVSRLDLRSAPWLTTYLLWVFLSSWLGPFGGGQGWLKAGAGFLLQAVVSTLLFLWALRCSHSREEMEREIERAGPVREVGT